MLKEKTLLVLGAGASKPYCFPTALELATKIISKDFEIVKSIYRKNCITEKCFENKLRAFTMHFLYDFNKAQPISIDEFVLGQKKNRNSEIAAKKLMVSYLLKLEEISEEISEYNWVELFFDIVSKGVASLFDDEENIDENFEKVKIITFNYERSFEHFLLARLNNSNKVNSAIAFLRSFQKNIIHIYGTIGNILDSFNESGVRYGFCPTNNDLYNIIDNIRLTYDERNIFDEKINKFLSDVEQVFFLGFGFDENNLENLRLNMIQNSEVKIFGTIKGRELEKEKVTKLILKKNLRFKKENIILEGVDCNTLIKEKL
jgi:hypothetical protein